MQAYLTLTRRELGSFFVSWIGYVVVAGSVFLMGLSFVSLVATLQSEATSMPITEIFLDSYYFWLILLFSAPVITMRLFSVEKYSGTFETLMTTPVGDWQVVLAKFTAAMFFYAATWLPLLVFILVLRSFASNAVMVDPGGIGSAFLGIFLIGTLYMAMGCFASSLTENQIVAAMISFAMGIGLFIVSFISEELPLQKNWVTDLLAGISMKVHMQDFARGVVDTRYVVFYLTLSAFFLFLTHRVVESRRWK